MLAKPFGIKGQTTFEFIVISTLSLLVILGMLRLVPETATSIGKIAVVKSEALKLLSEEEKFYYIADIEGPIKGSGVGVPDTITVLVGNVSPAELASLQAKFNTANLPQKLVDANFYSVASEVQVNIASAP
ncbi:MAG: hypothetical protein QXK06_03070 [Candidatus Diapherotrites archaeon]